jgi:hypothetical protein
VKICGCDSNNGGNNMSFSIKVAKPANFQETFAKLKDESSKHSISFKGDESNGRVSGYGFDGEYKVHQDHVEIIVHKKPFLVSEAMIKQKINEYMAKL